MQLRDDVNDDMMCSACEKEIGTPTDKGARWLICTHCGARTPNALAFDLHTQDGHPLKDVGTLGTLLVGLGGIGLIFGTLSLTLGASPVEPAWDGAPPWSFLVSALISSVGLCCCAWTMLFAEKQ